MTAGPGRSRLPDPPAFGAMLEAARADAGTLRLLALRRSTAVSELGPPGPDGAEIEDLLRLATRVPDHGKLAPWRFILFEGEARRAFGERLAEIALAEGLARGPDQAALERERFLRAPLVIGVVSRVVSGHKIPEWEQVLSAGALCQTLLIAAHAMGYGATWITEWVAYHEQAARLLALGPGERMAGFVHVGTARKAPLERVRPALADLVLRWTPREAASPSA